MGTGVSWVEMPDALAATTHERLHLFGAAEI